MEIKGLIQLRQQTASIVTTLQFINHCQDPSGKNVMLYYTWLTQYRHQYRSSHQQWFNKETAAVWWSDRTGSVCFKYSETHLNSKCHITANRWLTLNSCAAFCSLADRKLALLRLLVSLLHWNDIFRQPNVQEFWVEELPTAGRVLGLTTQCTQLKSFFLSSCCYPICKTSYCSNCTAPASFF